MKKYILIIMVFVLTSCTPAYRYYNTKDKEYDWLFSMDNIQITVEYPFNRPSGGDPEDRKMGNYFMPVIICGAKKLNDITVEYRAVRINLTENNAILQPINIGYHNYLTKQWTDYQNMDMFLKDIKKMKLKGHQALEIKYPGTLKSDTIILDFDMDLIINGKNYTIKKSITVHKKEYDPYGWI